MMLITDPMDAVFAITSSMLLLTMVGFARWDARNPDEPILQPVRAGETGGAYLLRLGLRVASLGVRSMWLGVGLVPIALRHTASGVRWLFVADTEAGDGGGR